MNTSNLLNHIKWDPRYYQDNFNWNSLAIYQNRSQRKWNVDNAFLDDCNKLDFIIEFFDKINFKFLLQNNKLSEEILDYILNNINTIITYDFSAKQIRMIISERQNLSEEFIIKNQNNLDFFEITQNKNLTINCIKKLKYKFIPYKNLLRYNPNIPLSELPNVLKILE